MRVGLFFVASFIVFDLIGRLEVYLSPNVGRLGGHQDITDDTIGREIASRHEHAQAARERHMAGPRNPAIGA